VRILIRTSKTAIWARRIGRIAIPLVILPVVMHHLGLIASPSFFIVAMLALAISALAACVGFLALVRLWFSGDQGWGMALSGLFLGLLCLVPFAYYGYYAWRYPDVTDIATVARGELPLLFLPDTANMPPPKLVTPNEQARIFPNATTRTYPLDVVSLFGIVKRLAENEGWDIRLLREPSLDGTPGRLNARITTIPGWREEAVFRVSPTPTGAKVDMRSASINAPHDFGSNGTRIERFMVNLDNEVTTLIRDNPNVNQPTTEEDDEPAPSVDGE
jgi:hypothetical protein